MSVRVKKANKICAVMIIIAMMVSNLWLIGEAVVSYAIDMAKTSSDNVELSAYFIDENKIETENKETKINEEEILYVKVRVKNEGYFNGKIKLENSNFEIDKNYLDDGVQEITENGDIILNQINAGTDKVVKLKVSAIEKEKLALKELQGETTIKLEGEYIDSKSVEKDKTLAVEGETTVNLKWVLPEESKLQLSGEVITNKKYKIDNEEKQIVQVLVSSRILGSNINAKVNEFELDKLEGAEEVFVQGRDFEKKNRKVSLNDNTEITGEEKITVTVNNEDEDFIICDDEEEEFIVTYILDANVDTINKQISVSEIAETYDEKELKEKIDITTGTEKEGIVTYEVETEEEIYKGKIQTGEEKEYKTEVKLNVNYEKLAEEIMLTEEEAKYKAGEEEIDANIFLKETKINKEEFDNMFGKDGYINILDEQGKVISNINKDSQTDEEGNIVVEYKGENKKLQIKTSKPIKQGTLTLENTKIIIENEKTKEEIKQLTEIEETIIAKNSQITSKINLIDTETEAKLEMNVDTLTTLETNENVKIAVTLLNNDETKDLYQNPKIRIQLPEQIKEINAKCKLLYGNGLNLGERKIIQEDGKCIIEINLDGTQSKYNAEEIRGTTVLIYAELGLDKLATNSEEKIILNYTNDIATSYKDEGMQELPIKIQSREGVITTNNIEEYGINTIGNEGTKQITIDENTEKDVSVKISAINNEESKIGDVKLLGHFPTRENDNLDISLKSGIEVETALDGVKIYYSDKENPTYDIQDEANGWGEIGNTGTTKSYLICADYIGKGEKLEAKFDIGIPAELPSNSSAVEDYGISYINLQTGEIKERKATTIQLLSLAEEKTTEKLDIKIKEIVGDDTIEEEKNEAVTLGEIIRYQVEITNKTDEEITDINIVENAPSGVKGFEYVRPDAQEGTTGYAAHCFQEIPTEASIDELYDEKTEENGVPENFVVDVRKLPLRITKTISSIQPNETKTIDFYVRPDNVEETLNTEFKVTANDLEITKNITNTVNSSKINVKLLPSDPQTDKDYLVGGNQYIYELCIENYTEDNIKNVKVQIITNDMFDVNKITYKKGDETINADNTKEITIESLEKTERTKIKIYVTPKETITDENITQIYAKVSYENTTLRTNKLGNVVKLLSVGLTAETTNQGGEVSVSDNVEYKFTLKNNKNGMPAYNIYLKETFSAYIDITEVLVNGEKLSEDDYTISPKFNVIEGVSKASDTEEILELKQRLDEEETKDIVVKGKVNTLAGRRLKQGDKISTKAVISDYIGVIAESNEVNHIFKPKETDEPDSSTKPDKPTDPTDPTKPENPDDENKTGNQNQTEDQNKTGNENKTEDQNKTNDENKTENQNKTDDENTPSDSNKPSKGEDKPKEETYSISGVAWFDENRNGNREDNEQRLSDINVKLLNLVTNDSKTVKTSSNGIYTITGVKKGNYVVIFEYDTEKYMLTSYQANGAKTNKNSDVENVTMMIDGAEKRVSSTDTIEITNQNITDIDIGLVLNRVFDLELEKTISKITVINNEGSKTTTYDEGAFAKLEINAKYIEGSTIAIEYKIKVKNTGEIAGYAKSIVDYKPADLQFDSNLNSEWYQSDNNLYSNSLANTKIEPGETKELTLVLTKTVTESNIGLSNNLAEIAEDYNAMGIEDKDSAPGNGRKEDDLGSCNLLIGIKTGAAISYIALTTSVFTMLIAGAYLINKLIIKKIEL